MFFGFVAHAAAADILVMPSRFEPCGLNQLYAMRYGTVPVAHKTGGLKDTVIDFNPWKNEGTGWTYTSCDQGVSDQNRTRAHLDIITHLHRCLTIGSR